MFSTGLCVVVGILVLVGVIYQIHLDRMSKKKKKEFQKQNSYNGRHVGEFLPCVRPLQKEARDPS